MSIRFSAQRWKTLEQTYTQWWAGDLERPIIQLTVWGKDPGRPPAALADTKFIPNFGPQATPEQIVDAWDYSLSRQEFLGDAFPAVWLNFGPGVAATFMGADLMAAPHTVWFHPHQDRDLADLDLAFEPDSYWLTRIVAIAHAAIDRWQGLVQVGMTDLGGALDILSTFRPGEKLLLDLYDAPELVHQAVRKIHENWFQAFHAIDAALQPINPGYTAWTPIFSKTPYYMLQCDFAYMISPDMFDTFVKPELTAACRRLDNPFYHLDGVGQLAHLDSLLEIPELKGVQWVPGAGQKDAHLWPEVYQKIRRAGKLIHYIGALEHFESVVDRVGSAKGFYLGGGCGLKDLDKNLRLLEKFRVV